MINSLSLPSLPSLPYSLSPSPSPPLPPSLPDFPTPYHHSPTDTLLFLCPLPPALTLCTHLGQGQWRQLDRTGTDKDRVGTCPPTYHRTLYHTTTTPPPFHHLPALHCTLHCCLPAPVPVPLPLPLCLLICTCTCLPARYTHLPPFPTATFPAWPCQCTACRAPAPPARTTTCTSAPTTHTTLHLPFYLPPPHLPAFSYHLTTSLHHTTPPAHLPPATTCHY